jgi:hypothetical protein
VANLREQADVSESTSPSRLEEPDRKCSRCQVVKPVAAFHRDGPGKWKSQCTSCRAESRPRRTKEAGHVETPQKKRARDLKWKYGITLKQYEQLLVSQGGGCAICRKPPGKKQLAVDHCHVSGRVRALLCPACNRAIGYYEFVRERAEAYIAAFGDGNPLLGYDG